MSYADKIVAIAKNYIGQQEIQPNLGFKDSSFEAKMRARGWMPGQSWCAYFAKQCWVEAYADQPEILALIKRCLSGGALDTLTNCKANDKFIVNFTPAPGALCVFADGHGPHGHEAVVVGSGTTFPTVEGNSNSDGSANGYEVVAHTRQTGLPFKASGLNIAGFIHPIEI